MAVVSLKELGDLPVIPGYELIDKIGSGATSIVYLCQQDGKKFAVKVMNPTEDAVKLGLRFRKEASTIARINDSSLVKIYEVGEHEGRSFVVMEVVNGPSLSQRLKEKPLNEIEVISFIKQIAEGLSVIHRFGLIHRDIKPDNILLENGAKVKLIDFGFAASAVGDDKNEMVGTLYYCSPEIFDKKRGLIDSRSDLYSVGIILYECLTGQRPFDSESSVELIKMHLDKEPPEGPLLSPQIRPSLKAITLKLLAKDLNSRYQSADGLVADLEDLAAIDEAIQKGSFELDNKKFRLKVTVDVPLIGREKEMGKMKEAWEQVKNGQGLLLQIEGEGGSGKSRLTQELMNDIGPLGAVLFKGKCQYAESTILGVLREAFDDYFVRLGRVGKKEYEEGIEQIKKAAGQNASILKRLCRSFSKIFEDAPEAGLVDPSIERVRLFSATIDLLKNLSKAGKPVVLLIDDVQWLDTGTAELLKLLADDLKTHRILLLTTSRNDSANIETVSQFLRDMESAKAVRLSLQPLEFESIKTFTGLFLGGSTLEDRAIEKLTISSKGNIFVIREYIRAMLDSGALYPTNSGWHVDFDELSSLTLSENVLDLVVTRISSLNLETQQILGAAAVIGIKFSVKILMKTCGLPEASVVQALASAQRANLIEPEDGDYFSIVHDRVMEALIRSLSPEKKKDTHSAVAQALKENPEDSIEYTFSIARHVLNGHTERNPKHSYEVLLKAGLVALSVYDNDRSLQFLQKAIEIGRLLPEREVNYFEIYSGLGQANYLKAQFNEAHKYFQLALEFAKEPVFKARICNAISMTYDKTDQNDEAWSWFLQGCTELGRSYPKNKIALVFSAIGTMLFIWLTDKTGWLFGKAKESEISHRIVLAELYESGTTTAVRYQDIVKMLYLALKNVANSHYLGATREYAMATAQCLGWALAMLGLKKGRYWAWRGVRIAEQLGDKALLTNCRLRLINVLGLSGDFENYDKLVDGVFADYDRYLYGHRNGMAGTIAHNLTLHARGHTRTLNDFSVARLPFMLKYGNFSYTSVFCYTLQFHLFRVGRDEEAYRIEDEIQKYKSQTISSAEKMNFHESNHFVRTWLEKGDSFAGREALEKHIQIVLKDPQIKFYYFREAPLVVGYVRLSQAVKAEGEAREKHLRELGQLLKSIWFFSTRQTVHRCHWLNLKAALLRENGQLNKANKVLQKAEKDALHSKNYSCLFEISNNRILINQRLNNETVAMAEAKKAMDIAVQSGWIYKQNQLRREYAVYFQNEADTAVSVPNNALSPTSQKLFNSSFVENYVDSLLRVSLASASTLSPEEQAITALDELIQVLGAERAFLFVAETEDNDTVLKMRAGRDSEGNDLPELKGYSSTVVKKAFDERAPVIVSGTDQGELLGSKSAVIHNLRSIMAVPLQIREERLGVVYLDNRMMKGLFSKENIDFLSAIASHIAINLKLVTMAHHEVEKKSLEKDLAVVAAIQSFFLPEKRSFQNEKVSLCGFYAPASQASGDWWWYDGQNTNSISILLGDVTGHGPGPAMLTASMASQLRVLNRMMPGLSPDKFLMLLNQELSAIAKGEFLMTMAAIQVDSECKVSYWNAAAPPIFILRKTGEIEGVMVSSSPLGTEDYTVDRKDLSVLSGDRLILYTDGLSELQLPKGRQIANRQLTDLFIKTQALSPEKAVDEIIKSISELRAGEPLRDDITLVIVDCLG